jgi:hypothetical protein
MSVVGSRATAAIIIQTPGSVNIATGSRATAAQGNHIFVLHPHASAYRADVAERIAHETEEPP